MLNFYKKPRYFPRLISFLVLLSGVNLCTVPKVIAQPAASSLAERKSPANGRTRRGNPKKRLHILKQNQQKIFLGVGGFVALAGLWWWRDSVAQIEIQRREALAQNNLDKIKADAQTKRTQLLQELQDVKKDNTTMRRTLQQREQTISDQRQTHQQQIQELTEKIQKQEEEIKQQKQEITKLEEWQTQESFKQIKDIIGYYPEPSPWQEPTGTSQEVLGVEQALTQIMKYPPVAAKWATFKQQIWDVYIPQSDQAIQEMLTCALFYGQALQYKPAKIKAYAPQDNPRYIIKLQPDRIATHIRLRDLIARGYQGKAIDYIRVVRKYLLLVEVVIGEKGPLPPLLSDFTEANTRKLFLNSATARKLLFEGFQAAYYYYNPKIQPLEFEKAQWKHPEDEQTTLTRYKASGYDIDAETVKNQKQTVAVGALVIGKYIPAWTVYKPKKKAVAAFNERGLAEYKGIKKNSELDTGLEQDTKPNFYFVQEEGKEGRTALFYDTQSSRKPRDMPKYNLSEQYADYPKEEDAKGEAKEED